MVWEVLKGSKRAREDLEASRRVLACLEDLVISLRVWEGPEGSEVYCRNNESLGGYGWA